MAKDSIQAPVQSADSVAVNTQIAVANDSVSTAKTDTIATVDAAASAATKEEDNSIGRGLELMVIGMLTVFTILLIVINLGKLLIKIVNSVAPEEKAAPKKAAAAAPAAIDANTMAILEQTVSQITGGKGHVASAKKI